MTFHQILAKKFEVLGERAEISHSLGGDWTGRAVGEMFSHMAIPQFGPCKLPPHG